MLALMASQEYERIVSMLANPEQREQGLLELSKSRLRTAASMAAPFLADRDAEVRQAAMECLLERGSRRYADRVARRLTDRDEIVRVTALECLASWKASAHWRKLTAMLRDPAPLVRGYAAWTLKELGATEAVPKLEKRVGRERNGVAKAGLYESLAVMTGEPRYIGRLCKLLTHNDDRTRAFAANSVVGVANANPGARPRLRAALSEALLREKNAGTREVLQQNLKLLPR
ncbi:MAG: HEAT repeat domain-containing protein [Proteobacteria bacterium]|nr:HEAT repeat domain-containing protein [Pseudomonadota bacterium]